MKVFDGSLGIVICALSLSIPISAVAQVDKGEPCKGAPNAAIVVWNGVGFSGPHSSHCTSHVLAKGKTHFAVSTVCTALGDGSPNNSDSGLTDSFLLERLSNMAFVMHRDGQHQRSLRWCSLKAVD